MSPVVHKPSETFAHFLDRIFQERFTGSIILHIHEGTPQTVEMTERILIRLDNRLVSRAG